METSIALLRGISVGGHRSVPMAALRELLLVGPGLIEVLAYIQSGNAVFTGAGTPQSFETRIEEAIAQRFGFEVDVIVRTALPWSGYVRSNPFPDESLAQPNFVMLMLSKAPVTNAAFATMRTRATGGERIERVRRRTVALFRPGCRALETRGGAERRRIDGPQLAHGPEACGNGRPAGDRYRTQWKAAAQQGAARRSIRSDRT